MLKQVWVASILAVLVGYSASVESRLIVEKRWVPVNVTDSSGNDVSQDIMVTIFHDDDAPMPYPALVLNHGRAPHAEKRAALGRAQYSAASRWLAQLGFMVAVPTRIGYGVSGGKDVEFTGDCGNKDYAPGYAVSATQTLAVLEYLRGRKEVEKDRAVIMGQSFGGTTAITIAAMNPPGVQAVVNFAGGGGGNSKTRPQNPCGQSKLKKLFADYGKTAHIPTLWIYTENDLYMGPKLPKVWFDAFRSSGGTGEFVLFPPNGEDGHGLFTHAPEVWQPKVLEFLRANGYPNIQAPASIK
ncbi:MAG: alpha/beta hydrolase [Candidatus Competibacteraceae bacterium]